MKELEKTSDIRTRQEDSNVAKKTIVMTTVFIGLMLYSGSSLAASNGVSRLEDFGFLEAGMFHMFLMYMCHFLLKIK